MGRLRQLLKNSQSLAKVFEKEIYLVVSSEKAYIIDLNTAQLMKGEDSDEKSLGFYKSPAYAEMKMILNPRGVVDLKLTGNFHESFFLEDSGNDFPFTINATDEKRDELVEKYGEGIFGLSEKSLADLREHLLPIIRKRFLDLLHL